MKSFVQTAGWKPVGLALLLAAVSGFFSCSQHPEENGEKEPEFICSQSDIYYDKCDSVVRYQDSTVVYCSACDTQVVSTGILRYLVYDYPLTVPDTQWQGYNRAAELFQAGKFKEAHNRLKNMLDYHYQARPEMLKRFTDLNDYWRYENNMALLASQAHWLLVESDSALAVLRPCLSNSETHTCGVRKRYAELCSILYNETGIEEELDRAAGTLRYEAKIGGMAGWYITVFGANWLLSVNSLEEKITPEEATSLLKKEWQELSDVPGLYTSE